MWVGLISYPLYLWHWPLLVFAQAYTAEPLSRIIRIELVVIAILLAWATYRFIENPIRKASSQQALLKPIRTSLVLIMVVVATLGLTVYLSGGISARMPPSIRQLSEIEFDHTKRTRVGTCFLLTGQTSKDFSKCEDYLVPNRQSVLLIGDSHASHLYPGLQARFGEKLNIIQRTAGGCPPMFNSATDVTNDLCKDVNQYIQQFIAQNGPQIVILSANWLFYRPDELSQTIHTLKSEGIRKIVVVGPVPQWRDSLIKQLFLRFSKTGVAEVPFKTSQGLNSRVFEVDRQIADIAASMKVDYVSPYQLLCDAEGCLTRYGSSLDTLMTWDYGHLTNGGSEHLVSMFPDIVADE